MYALILMDDPLNTGHGGPVNVTSQIKGFQWAEIRS